MPERGPWRLARRSEAMNPSIIREILKVTERPGILSMAGGLPSPDTFPVDAIRAATLRVLEESPREALQYAASEGYPPLREWVAARLAAAGLDADPDRVLITSGSQQGLDLAAKVLIDRGTGVAVETPTYLGALQAFAPFEPELLPLACDDEGPLPEAVAPAVAAGAAFAYLLPNFQNPAGRLVPEGRRAALAEALRAAGLPVVEDDPYGDIWFDAPPPPALAARWPGGVVHLGSFSKILTPGFRLGYVLAPAALAPKFLQAKQAADLHTPGLTQRVVHEVVRDGFLDAHVPTIRERYRRQRDAMEAALHRHMPPGTAWTTPAGGMFVWVRLPEGLDAMAMLPAAVGAGVAYVPGEAFYAGAPDPRTMRLSFVTLGPADLETAVARLGEVVALALRPARAE